MTPSTLSALRGGPARSALSMTIRARSGQTHAASAAAAASMNCSRSLRTQWSRPFHATPRPLVSVGDVIPSTKAVMEGSPGNKIDLAKEIGSGKAVIIGVPAAFSPACSESHIPGYINSSKLASAGKVFVVAVNDAFVTKAWGNQLDPDGKSGIRFLADPSLELTNALDLSFDGSAIFGGHRSKRYALLVENGKVKEAFVEPDNTGLNVSAADKVLK